MTRSLKTYILNPVAFAFLLSGLSACSLLERRMQNENGVTTYSPRANERHVLEAKEELGIKGRYLSAEEQQRLEERVYLKQLEARLQNRSEKAQYYQIKSALRNDQERIQFLTMGSAESKARWIKAKGLNLSDTHSNEIAEIIEKQDIAVGMSQSAVRESWGDPDVVEVAGDVVYGYEKWKYQRFMSGNDGYQKESRAIYFEGGRVVGWETN